MLIYFFKWSAGAFFKTKTIDWSIDSILILAFFTC